MRKTICTLIMLSMIGCVQAKTLECIGMDRNTHKTWKVITNEKTGELIINGDVLQVESRTAKNANPFGVFTKNFITEDGTYVYDAIEYFSKGEFEGRIYMVQRNAVTKKIVGYVELSCSIN